MLTDPIVVIGASAGGIEALQALVAGLPQEFPAAICVVLHLNAHHPSTLPAILSRAGPLPALHPRDGELLQPGHIYIAPPDHHLLVEGDRLGVKKGPKENRFRPAVDALFRSAAHTRAPHVIGVVLSGVLDDGTSGLWNIKRLGGVAVVQDPQDAAFDAMPRHALEQVEVNYQVRAQEMGPLLAQLVQDSTLYQMEAAMDEQQRERLAMEVHIAAEGPKSPASVGQFGSYTPFTCPECHGAMVQIQEGEGLRFRCHTGHAYTSHTLLTELSETIEDKLYQTQRAMEEGILLLERLSQQLSGTRAEALLRQARWVEQRAKVLHQLALTQTPLSDGEPLVQ
ncbi:chemotaxis protein CheB [Deinococcus sp. QL22]|uniref:chemotaxis protein CheB n=1 Tax=Deinococcus sp. QL22 TaxID=2939437 RepID=UPI0020175570|nr:chemotaxis protein CheB [Deinococcus sp. QL22]UQN10760.1 chemotaxis protein CheB [Deinococcus sp. QL22]UQN10806.1 chemotaxis protein CheB [Deinococcus sp. QL22]